MAKFDVQAGVFIDAANGSGAGTTFVDGDFPGQAVQIAGALPGSSGCSHVTFGGEKKVRCVARLVDCAVQVFPLASTGNIFNAHRCTVE